MPDNEETFALYHAVLSHILSSESCACRKKHIFLPSHIRMNENSQLKLVIVLEYTIYSQQKPRQFLSPLLLTLIYLTFFCSLYLEFLCRTSKGATSASCSIAGSLVQSCWVYCLWRILHVLQMHMWVPLFCFFQQTPKNKAVGRLAKLNCPRCENSSIFYSPNER